MTRFPSYESVPSRAAYLGSEDGPGNTCEALEDAISAAIDLAYIEDAEGCRSYFDLNS